MINNKYGFFWLDILPDFSKLFGNGNYMFMRCIIHHLLAVSDFNKTTAFSITYLTNKNEECFRKKYIHQQWSTDKIMQAVEWVCEKLEIVIEWK